MKNTLKDLLLPFANPLLSRIHRYKDVHRGESCYLFGYGVSVKWFDLAAFADKLSIPCGYLPFHNDFYKLNVRYLLLVEPWWFYPVFSITKKLIRNHVQLAYRQAIANNPDKQFFLNLSNYPVVRSKNVTFLFRDIYDDRLPADFITRRINALHGSLRSSVLMAIYMGFQHCYLVGYDYTHVPSRSRYWYEKGKGIYHPIPNYNKEFFDIAKTFIDITTITLDGTSEVLNSVTYQEHTGRAPMYKENTKIVDERHLNALATWPVYRIW